MVGSIATSPAVDLSTVPAPELVAQPDLAARRAGKLARLIELHAEFTALVESDPAVKLIEADSYDEQVLAQAFNDTARGLLLAYASGSNLDQLGALNDVARLVVTPATETTAAVLESDTSFRQRIQLARHSFSVAGPELAYVHHARAAHGDVADATAISPAPGDVVVTVMSRSNGGVPRADVLSAVSALLKGPVRPLTDRVTVQEAQPVRYAIEAEIFPFAGPDQQLILDTARKSLDAYLTSTRKLGRDIACSAHIAALHVGNVQRVRLISPAADTPVDMAHFPEPTAINLRIGGTEL